MKKLSFLRRLFPGKPSPAPAPQVPQDDYRDKYIDLLIQHSQTLREMNEVRAELIFTNQQYTQMVQDQAQVEIENSNLRLILSGNYRTDRKPDPIY